MTTWLLLAALILVLTIAAGMVRIMRGPSAADRMQAAQLFGTTGVAILLLLTYALEMPILANVALVFALLGVVAAVAFVRMRVTENESD